MAGVRFYFDWANYVTMLRLLRADPDPARRRKLLAAFLIGVPILAALGSGALYAASLDVFQIEPLPAESALWLHPRVVVTPHNAAESSPLAIARYALRQMKLQAQGASLENMVDRERGY